MRTGRRCTTLIQFPVAFWAGISAKAEPVPPLKPADHSVVDDLVSVEVGDELDLLPGAHLLELNLLEVGVHIHLPDGYDREQGRGGLHALAELHLSPRDDSIHRRADHRTSEIHLGFVHLSLGKRHGGLGGIQRGTRIAGAVDDTGQLVPRDRARGDECLTALQVNLGALDVGRGRDHLCIGARELGLRLTQRQSSVRVVDDDQHIPVLDLLAVHHVHLGNRPLDLGGDERYFGGRVGVVGLHVARADVLPVRPVTSAGREDDECKQAKHQCPFASRGRARARLLRGRIIGGGGSGVRGGKGYFDSGVHGNLLITSHWVRGLGGRPIG